MDKHGRICKSLAMRLIRPLLRCFFCACAFVSLCEPSGCAEADGSEPYAIFETYVHPKGLYQFRYLAPPWVLLEKDEDGGRQLLAIEPDGKDIGFDLEQGYLQARLKIVVETRDHETVKAAVAEDVARWEARGAEVGPLQTFESDGGAVGLEVETVSSGRRMASVYHLIADSRVAVMSVAGQESLTTYDMMLMLRGFEPLSSGR
jgi:hypothetical protein